MIHLPKIDGILARIIKIPHIKVKDFRPFD